MTGNALMQLRQPERFARRWDFIQESPAYLLTYSPTHLLTYYLPNYSPTQPTEYRKPSADNRVLRSEVRGQRSEGKRAEGRS